jgi:hypothetical protein
LDLQRIIDSSKKYYLNKNNGRFNVRYLFKSSIAESYLIENIEISYCKKKGLLNIATDQYSFRIKKKKYYYIDTIKQQYIDYTYKKLFRKEKKESLNIYPQFNSNYFSIFSNKKYKINIQDGLIHIYDFIDHFFFDTINYSIVKYKNYILTNTGIQIKEWQISEQLNFENCNRAISNDDFISTYTKVVSFNSIQKHSSFIGLNFWDIIENKKHILDDGKKLIADSFKKKLTLVDIFYQSCMPCIQSFSDIKELYPYIFKGNLDIIGVDPVINDSASMINFKKRYNLTYPVLIGNDASRLNDILNPNNIFPFSLLLNSEGIILETIEGYNKDYLPGLKEKLQKLSVEN